VLYIYLEDIVDAQLLSQIALYISVFMDARWVGS